MSFLLRGLFWLSVLGGAAVGVGFPTNNAVKSIFNKQKIREQGWNVQAGRDYEDYWYGNNGFGDARTKKVSTGNWNTEIKTALSNVRQQWGKNKLGEGLEKGFEKWLKTKKYCDVNGESSGNQECSVGKIEFIDEKGKNLFGRIPIQDNKGIKSNIYVKWVKCTNTDKNTKKIGGVWFGLRRKEGNNSSASSTAVSSSSQKDYSWCSEELKKKEK